MSADRPREWSTDGRTYTRTGIRCVSIGLPHEWMHMGRAGQHDVYVCDACGCWSRVERALSTDPVILARVPLIDAELMRRSAGRVDRQCAPDGWTDDGFRGHIEWTDDGPRHT